MHKRCTFVNFTDLTVPQQQLVLTWRNNELVRRWMFESAPISSEQHHLFLKSLKQTSSKTYWLVYSGSEPIGVCYLTPSIQKSCAEFGMYVNPHKLRQGLGSLLLQSFLEQKLPLLGLDCLCLSVYKDNKPAIALYQKFGFTTYKTTKEIGKGAIVHMKKVKKLSPYIQINGRKIGPGHPTYIVAELSCNHLQQYDLAVRTIEAVAKTGADAIKIQTYKPDTMTIDCDKPDFRISQGTIWDGVTFYSLYEEAYTPWEWQPKLQKVAADLGLDFFSSPFDITAADFLETLNVPVYKIASFEIRDIPLIRHIAKKGKPMIISTGIADLADIKLALKVCHEEGNTQIALLKCTSAYPTPLEDVNLLTMPDIAKKFRVVAGLSDHTLGHFVAVAAVALGASIVEKHVILKRSQGGPDSKFSMEPEEFAAMVTDIRNVEKSLGVVKYELSQSSEQAKTIGRSLYVVEDVRKGDTFTPTNVRSIRPGYGLPPKYLPKILGKVATQNIERGTRFSLDFVQ